MGKIVKKAHKWPKFGKHWTMIMIDQDTWCLQSQGHPRFCRVRAFVDFPSRPRIPLSPVMHFQIPNFCWPFFSTFLCLSGWNFTFVNTLCHYFREVLANAGNNHHVCKILFIYLLWGLKIFYFYWDRIEI